MKTTAFYGFAAFGLLFVSAALFGCQPSVKHIIVRGPSVSTQTTSADLDLDALKFERRQRELAERREATRLWLHAQL